MSPIRVKLDFKDREIIKMLKKDARISQEEISKRIDLSRPTIQKRIKSLEENGVILRYTIITDDRKLGKEITAFILVVLDGSQQAWKFTKKNLVEKMKELEILEIHYIAGADDVLLKIKTRNVDSLETSLMKIKELKGIARTRTMISLSSVEDSFPIAECSSSDDSAIS